jgi:septal ring factor EnvC (AmiA/AmiB activator)
MGEVVSNIGGYNLSTIITVLGIVCTSLIGVYNIVKKILAIFEAYRQNVNKIESKDKDIYNKLEELENKISEDRQKIDHLKSNIEKLESEVSNIKTDITKANRVTSRNAVYKLANELIAKQWMSQSESDSIRELCDIYMKTGDNNYIIPNIIQRALSLPVLTEEEIEAKMSGKG